jgi:hypothetical protein
MLTAVRTAVLAGLLFTPIGAHGGAAQAVADRYALEFLGFRAGARLDELSRQLEDAGGRPLRCRRAKADHRVMECRGMLPARSDGTAVDLWISAIDSTAGVMALSSRLDTDQLAAWRRTLQDRYGRVGIRVQGTQSMQQWVRRGRMLRLTWRLQQQDQIASVSLVDGHVLDGWGRTRMSPTAAAESRAPSAANRRAGSDSSRPSPRASNPEPRGSTP